MPTLDLHGETAEAARDRAERWLRAQQRGGFLELRVVTGRGLHSVGPPVLPGEIRDLLSALSGTLVDDWWAESSGGALRVTLRSLRSTPLRSPHRAATSAGAAATDPELRARAEQGLWDLGIHATPVLIEAEIRRLRSLRGAPQSNGDQ